MNRALAFPLLAVLWSCADPSGGREDTDKQAVQEARASLEIGFAPGDSATWTTKDLTLPSSAPGEVRVMWTTGTPSLVSSEGAVYRPAAAASDGVGFLTARLSKGAAREEKGFVLTVKSRSATGSAPLGPVPGTYGVDPSAYGLNGKTLYVDATLGNDGNTGVNEEFPLKTIQRGVDLAGAGDRVFVKSGLYQKPNGVTDSVVVVAGKSGTAAHWIFLGSYPGHTPRILSQGRDAVKLRGCSYIIVSGFSVVGNADQVTSEYATAHQNDADNALTQGSGITVGPSDTTPRAFSHHIVIANNLVSRCCGSGIGTLVADYVEIRNNVTWGNANWSPYAGSGISLYQNWNSDASAATKMIVSANVSYGNLNGIPMMGYGQITDGNGIIIDDARHTQDFGDNSLKNQAYSGRTLVENNLCFNNGARGINIFLSDRVDVRFNTLYWNLADAASFSGEGELRVQWSDQVSFTGNLVVSRPRRSVKAFSNYQSTNVVLDSNLLSGDTDGPGPGTHALVGIDPRLIAPQVDPVSADFRPRAESPAVGRGPLPGPVCDLAGAVRGTLATLGCYEPQR